MNIKELYEYLCADIPQVLSCPWDNDGLMAAREMSAEVKKVLVSLDATEAAIGFASANGFDVLLTHHPMIFKGMKHVTPLTLEGRRVIAALSGGVAVLSFHTRLDAVKGGVNDALCAALGLTPDGVFGDEESPSLGRLVTLSEKMTLRELAAHVKKCLGAPYVKVISGGDGEQKVQKIAVCGGDGKDFTYPALAAGAEVLITGSSGYNMAEDAAECGIATIEAGHYYTEAPVCKVLAERIKAAGISCAVYNSCKEHVL